MFVVINIVKLPFLQFYSKNKGSIATTLLKPKQKQGTKSAEDELSKSKSRENHLRYFYKILYMDAWYHFYYWIQQQQCL